MSKKKKKKMNLEDLMGEINDQYGEGTVLDLESDLLVIGRIPTGSIGLDYVTGGGYPQGRFVELLGWQSSGKSTLCLHAIKEAQEMGLKCAYIDTENAFDSTYATNVGVNKKDLIISKPVSGETAFDIAIKLVESDLFGLVVLDSLATMTPEVELEGDVGDKQMGLQARMMSKGMRMLNSAMTNTKTCVIMVNQYRDKIGVMFGPSKVPSGGNAPKYYASLRLDITSYDSKTEENNEGEKINKLVKIKAIKNKVAPPMRECELKIKFGKGFDTLGEIIDMAVEQKIINKSGSWFNYEDTKLGQGLKSVRSILKDNPELLEEIKSQI